MWKFKAKLKGFTLAEVLVTLVLTSLAITFSYSVLSYTQKLFYMYKAQNKFMNQYTEFKKRMDHEALKATYVREESKNNFVVLRNNSIVTIQVLAEVILMKSTGRCDTFHIAAKNIQKGYALMKNPEWANKLVSSLQFETEFTKQKFNFSFYKEYDASVKLKLDQEN